ncbi:LacI family DNA-binding transcriptional regulator [Rubrivirga sp. IMCC45206]|uniref:LacI family DNA-binding transcriptional regulator n=1 Tax=Rubrivirga sp. IMCC45206 TaxID=3391614 RepID=UPI00398FFA74
MPVTIYDIADKAGVSIATVSRAFNGHPRVSESTRQKVFGVAEELGYVPHASAQSLARQSTQLLSAVLPMMTSAFFMEVLRGVQDRLDETDYDLLVYASRSVDRVGAQLDRAVQRGRADGLFVISTPLDDARAAQIAASRQPAVLIDAHHPAVDSVAVDNHRGGAVATQHLLDRGHTRIAMLMPAADSGPGVRRRAGYLDTLEAAGLPRDPDLIVEAEWDEGHHGYTRYAGYRGMQALLARFEGRTDAPTAVFAAADVLAYGALRAAREAGLRAPRDLDLVGFDDVESSAYAGLTTVRQPMYEMGRVGADLLLRRLDGADGEARHVVFAPEIVVRESTGGTEPLT